MVVRRRYWRMGVRRGHGEEWLQGEGVTGVVVRRGNGRSGCEEGVAGAVVRRAWQEWL